MPAAGAAGPEKIEEARTNAPQTVLAFDRIVSLRDFEDFARGFAGIGKAQAVPLWDGEMNSVHITVTTASGKPLSQIPELYQNLVDAIRKACDRTQVFRVDDYTPVEFLLDVAVKVDYPRCTREEVLDKVKTALYEAFSFERRELGQPVTAAEIVTIIHQIEGVVAVDLSKLYMDGDPEGRAQIKPPPVLQAAGAKWNKETRAILPAQLLLLKPGGVTIREMSTGLRSWTPIVAELRPLRLGENLIDFKRLYKET